MQTAEPTTRRGLVRRPTGRVIAGVAGGLGDATGTHAAWWRVGFVFLALVGGLGVAIYLILWIVVPRADLPRSAGQRLAERFPGIPGWVGVTLLGIGVILLVGKVWPTGLFGRPSIPFGDELRHASPGVAIALGLIGLGILLFRRDDGVDRGSVDGVTDVLALEPRADPDPGSGSGGSRRSRRRRRREPSVLGWLTFGVALAVGGLTWLLLDTGSIELGFSQALAIPLAILGAGLLIGSIVGRARWPILLGLLLIPLVVVGSLIPTPITGRYTDRTIAPVRASQLRSLYHQSGGLLTLDLTQLREGERPGPIEATLGAGGLRVIVPKSMTVEIEGAVGLGNITWPLGPGFGGWDLDDTYRWGSGVPVRLDLEVGIGQVTVWRVPVARAELAARRDGGDGS